MMLFVCTDHDVLYPVGGASVVVASNEDEARRLLDAELVSSHLSPSSKVPYTLKMVSLDAPKAVVLQNGDY